MTSVAPDVAGARLSERLRAARNQRGLSLPSASEGSKVALRYLRMFEEGDYPMVADPVYLAYFMRRYAAFLGLNEIQASREFITETEDYRADTRSVTESKPPVVGNHPQIITVEEKDSQVLHPLVFPPRRIPRTRLGRGSRPVGSRTGGSRSRLFNFYAGPLSVIAMAWAVGPFSLLNLWVDETPPRVPMVESREAPSSAVPIARAIEASQKPEPAATSPMPATLPLTTEPPPSPVKEPNKKLARSSSTLESHRIATDQASDALRAEQLERMKAATVSADSQASADRAS